MASGEQAISRHLAQWSQWEQEEMGLRIDVPPRISQEGFALILRANDSPAAPWAAGCYAAIAAHGADPATGLGFFMHESTYGTKGRARNTHGWGNQKKGTGWAIKEGYADGVDKDGFLVFLPRAAEADGAEWIRSAECWAVLVMDKYDAKTVEQITPFYAPAGAPDYNQPARYAAAVIAAVLDWAEKYPPEDEPEPAVPLEERLAALLHEIWSGWATWMMEKIYQVDDEGTPYPDHWHRQAGTPYAQLSEAEKESDRVEARKVLALLEGK